MAVELHWQQKLPPANLLWFGQGFESRFESGLIGAPPIKVIFGVLVQGNDGGIGPDTQAALNEWRELPDLSLILLNRMI